MRLNIKMSFGLFWDVQEISLLIIKKTGKMQSDVKIYPKSITNDIIINAALFVNAEFLIAG
jgi:hypothetical protein